MGAEGTNRERKIPEKNLAKGQRDKEWTETGSM